WFPEDGPLMKIEVALLKDVATLTIDTTGAGLHQRGYRALATGAPLKETLAAALVILARWYPDIALIDPFCGSGTIPIEAALIGHNIAPGLKRSFAAEDWPWISPSFWKQVREEAQDLINPEEPDYLIGYDIDDNALKIARHNAETAGVADSIHFQRQEVKDLTTSKKYGKLITNPPYGERLGESSQVHQLYRELAQIKKSLDTWSFYILTAYPQLEKVMGGKATKRRKLYNGNIETQYYQYFGPRPPRRSK
ncbi:MAG: class I SAM-dependent RNA methyltransferase, partial [Firmicutes bacterium]|nr:class I SAM-dependent RNA methyltransferase [Bacillota bacterium]